MDVYALETVGNGLLRLRLGLTNNSGENFLLYSGLSDQENLHTASQITLLDAVNQTRHLSYEQTSGSCFCASTDGNVATGETLDLWVVYPEPPSDVETMTITTPMTPPIMDVPITQSSETVENSGLEEPEIIPLTMISDNIEDQTGRTENNDEVSIILASDVLFETNSANLSPDSQEILAQVATEIDDASAGVVNIDGYADNTGNDSVNLPLSSERAEAVEGTLQELVSREGVTFEVEGHGSADPIADNETEEGRERNRRVTVTFAK
ncbi:OmpA family protein [Nocardiopsis tropica]|uniref:OmpA family protein n=1 Tax=Nocardiopsis tropica TaxID=109330 RepID=A0ABV1ZPZ8_9ACTN